MVPCACVVVFDATFQAMGWRGKCVDMIMACGSSSRLAEDVVL